MPCRLAIDPLHAATDSLGTVSINSDDNVSVLLETADLSVYEGLCAIKSKNVDNLSSSDVGSACALASVVLALLACTGNACCG